MSVRLLVVDGDEDARILVRLWLEDSPEDVVIVGEASGAEEAVTLAQQV